MELFRHLKYDLPAGIVVFFVAVPLCLGIALASEAPLFSGIIAGIIGGIIVGAASGSPLGVSGPAAGLVVIIATATTNLGGWEIFLLSVVIAGVLQVIAGFAGGGAIANYFPSSVIKGMLAGIGLFIILKEIPHAVGYNPGLEAKTGTSEGLLDRGIQLLNAITPGAVVITLTSLLILLWWEKVLTKKHKIFQIIPGPLVCIGAGILFSYLFQNGFFNLHLENNQLVHLPVTTSFSDFIGEFSSPDFTQILNPHVYVTAFVIAAIASLETLLCVDATDKLDPFKRTTPTNRELKAQGLGNILSGLIGGLPITQVIARSSANITFGGRTKMSAIFHGILLLLSVVSIPKLLNLIPLASLASILIIVGYKLATPALFGKMYSRGWDQFLPFFVTVAAILLTDLLIGISSGMVVVIFFVLINKQKNSYRVVKEKLCNGEKFTITLSQEVSFLNKSRISQTLEKIPQNSLVLIDGSNSSYIHSDVLGIITDFCQKAPMREIHVTTTIPTLSPPFNPDSPAENSRNRILSKTRLWKSYATDLLREIKNR